MATLQKFKLLATHCVVAASPTRSPTMSPVIHLRRRKTLRMLLSRTGGGSRRLPQLQESPDRKKTLPAGADPPEITKESVVVSHKLKDLLISSPPLEETTPEKVRDVGDGFAGGGGVGGRLGGRQCSLRPLSATFRQRLLRRMWRPVLITIPEAE